MTVPCTIPPDLLKSVSRSFYLSIQFLPGKMREPIAIGYLLARATDTIADSGNAPLEVRKSALHQMAALNPDIAFGSHLGQISHSGEQQLLRSLPAIFDWLDSLSPANQKAVEKVLTTIISGQIWDLEHFTGENQSTSPEELMQYTYQVAGCVGEFWTEVGFENLGDHFADYENRDLLMEHGKRFGKGLQLINIIRDLHEDLPKGRNYLPDDEISHWLEVCRDHLESGAIYVKHLRNRKAKFATALPLYLAEATAEKLEKAGIDQIKKQKIKISRKTVFKMAIKAALFS